MKLSFTPVIIIALAYACSPKTSPTIPQRPVEPITGNKPDTMQLHSANPLIAGRAVYHIKCTTCHDAFAVNNYTKKQWAIILPDMIKLAKLTEQEIRQLTTYVNHHAKK